MYERVVENYNKKESINLGLIIFLLLIGIFFYRIMNVLSESTERGGFAYVQILNFTLPVLEIEAYNEEDYAENNLSIKRVCLEALGLESISSIDILSDEVGYFNILFKEDNIVADNYVTPFVINENTIERGENIEGNSTVGIDNIDQSLVKPLDNTKPEVLIYHTHTTEAFNGNVTSEDSNYNIVGVGDSLKKELEKYGISVLHDTTNHYESYNGCYDRSNTTVRNYLNQYGDFKLIIDLHRDSAKNKELVTTTINGENVAKIMFVNTKNSSRYSENCIVVEGLTDIFNADYPNFMRSTLTYEHGILAFNQDLSNNSILIECGSYVNSIDEAINSTKYIANAIAKYLNK